MLPCHSCYIYGTWWSKEVVCFKVIMWMEEAQAVANQGDNVTHKKLSVELTPELVYLN